MINSRKEGFGPALRHVKVDDLRVASPARTADSASAARSKSPPSRANRVPSRDQRAVPDELLPRGSGEPRSSLPAVAFPRARCIQFVLQALHYGVSIRTVAGAPGVNQRSHSPGHEFRLVTAPQYCCAHRRLDELGHRFAFAQQFFYLGPQGRFNTDRGDGGRHSWIECGAFALRRAEPIAAPSPQSASHTASRARYRR